MVHNTGDKFVIEIGEVIERHGEPPLYKIAGFNALVFDEFGLNRLGKLTNGVDDGYMANLKQKDRVKRLKSTNKHLTTAKTEAYDDKQMSLI